MPTPQEIQCFNPTKWLNEYAKPALPIDNDLFDQIFKFSLIWSLFERHACNRWATWGAITKTVSQAIERNHVNTKDFQAYIDYFRSRAVSHHDGVDGYVAALNTRNPDMDEQIRNLLNGTVQTPNSALTALFLIALRVRNNLFHGNKDVAYIHNQAELFKFINSMLAMYLSKIKGPD